LNCARLPVEPTAKTVMLSQLFSPWKVARKSPAPSAVALAWPLRRPFAVRVTFSPGAKPVPLTTSGRCRTGTSCGAAADEVVLW
jgi:hypothetical protein